MALFRRNAEPLRRSRSPSRRRRSRPGSKKDRPTPTRKEAEAARRQRVTPDADTKKEARAEAAGRTGPSGLRAMSARERAPEKALMRDYIDSRRNLGEYLLPSVVV